MHNNCLALKSGRNMCLSKHIGQREFSFKENLMNCTPEISGKLPMILIGDFNVNFALDAALSWIEFLDSKCSLKMCSSSTQSTTRSKTVIDLVFARHIKQLEMEDWIMYTMLLNVQQNVK